MRFSPWSHTHSALASRSYVRLLTGVAPRGYVVRMEMCEPSVALDAVALNPGQG